MTVPWPVVVDLQVQSGRSRAALMRVSARHPRADEPPRRLPAGPLARTAENMSQTGDASQLLCIYGL